MTEETLYVTEREAWRKWLSENFQTKNEIWLLYPKVSSGKPRIEYNTAVEEALCFRWIDSKIKSVDDNHSMQKYSPRRDNSQFSQPNRERLQWLHKHRRIHPSVLPKVQHILNEKFHFPTDIISQLKKDKEVWKNYSGFSESYKRLRIAYIDSARNRPEEFEKRLQNFMNKTKTNTRIKGFGGIEKYY